MTLLCLVIDLRSIPPPLIRDLKQKFLQLANLYAISCSCGKVDMFKVSAPPQQDRIALCYIKGSRNGSSSSELKIAYRPTDKFSLCDLHHAINNLPTDCFLPELSDSFTFGSVYPGDELSLLELLSDKALYFWCGEDVLKKVICITSFVYADSDDLRSSLMAAAERCIMVEFNVLEQCDMDLHQNVINKIDGFVNCICALENCVSADNWTLHGLVKRWLQDIRYDAEPLKSVLLFRNPILGHVKQISCNLFASFTQIIDGVAGCQTCRLHGFPINNSINTNTKRCCSSIGCELEACDVVENAAKVGEQAILFLPCFEGSSSFKHISSPIILNVVERTSLASLDEGLIMGKSYVLTPASNEMESALDETDRSDLNSQLFRAVCDALFILDQALVCSSTCNTETMLDGAFQCFYILQPSDKGLILLRKLAAAEETLPIPEINQSNDSVIPQEMKNSVETSLLEIDLKDYNPLEHERGLHPKLNWLVKEGLQFGSLMPQRVHKLPKGNNQQQQEPLLQQHLAQATQGMHSGHCVTEEWEQLLVIDDVNDGDSISSMSELKFQSSTLAESKPLDEKTSRILERLEGPKQQKIKRTSPSISNRQKPVTTSTMISYSSINGLMKKPLLPVDINSSQPMKPNFQRAKRKQRL